MNPTTFKAGYKVIKNKKLVVEVFAGIMTLVSYKTYKQKQSEDNEFSPQYNLFVDMQDVFLDGTVDEVEDYVNFVLSNGGIVGDRRNATIINTMNQHVHANIFAKLHENDRLPQDFRIFTDIEEALDFLHIDVSVSEMYAIIAEIKESKQTEYTNNRKY